MTVLHGRALAIFGVLTRKCGSGGRRVTFAFTAAVPFGGILIYGDVNYRKYTNRDDSEVQAVMLPKMFLGR